MQFRKFLNQFNNIQTIILFNNNNRFKFNSNKNIKKFQELQTCYLINYKTNKILALPITSLLMHSNIMKVILKKKYKLYN